MDVEAIDMSIVDAILNDSRLRRVFRLVVSCQKKRFLSDKQFVCWLMNFLQDVEYFLVVEKVGGRVLCRIARHRITGEQFDL